MSFLSLALLLATQSPDSPTLLPAAPEGWRFERLDFPLSFAPALDHAGFEELWFAPGMFEPESESYFSYVFAMRLEGDVDLYPATVTPFLETYYRGLCKAVASSRDLEIDSEKIRVRLDDHTQDTFRGSIDMFDAFGSGEPLKLAFEISVHPGPRITEILGLVSPQQEEAAVWNTLRSFETPWRRERTVPVFLNHTYSVPDQETFDALAGSEFLREAFAVTEERETVRNDLTYSGFYLYGKRTYFEFLPPTAERSAGASGVAFGLETSGRTGELARELKKQEIQTFAGPLTRKAGEEEVPWFEIMGVEKAHMKSRMDLFTMEYDPRFLKRWHGSSPPAGEGLARRAVLRRYAHKLGQDPDEKLFEDVTAVFLSVDAKERERLFATLRVFGYEIEERANAWTCFGPEVRLEITLSDSPGQVTGLELRLRRSVEREPMAFGRATLRFEGARAWLTWG